MGDARHVERPVIVQLEDAAALSENRKERNQQNLVCNVTIKGREGGNFKTNCRRRGLGMSGSRAMYGVDVVPGYSY